MKRITVMLKSEGPMLMHSDRLSDPFAEVTKRHKALTSDRTFKKTDEGIQAIAKSEYMASLYLDHEGQVCLPALNVRKSLVEGARLYKGGKEVERGVVFLDQSSRLIYDGPSNIEKLWEDKRFVDSRSVVVSRARLIRYRPLFNDWSAAVEVAYNDEVINVENLLSYWKSAGESVGLGDFRPLFGRYSVNV